MFQSATVDILTSLYVLTPEPCVTILLTVAGPLRSTAGSKSDQLEASSADGSQDGQDASPEVITLPTIDDMQDTDGQGLPNSSSA
jgi:hypothetical protein